MWIYRIGLAALGYVGVIWVVAWFFDGPIVAAVAFGPIVCGWLVVLVYGVRGAVRDRQRRRHWKRMVHRYEWVQLTEAQERMMLAKWRRFRNSYGQMPAYTAGDRRHQAQYAVNRLGKVYERARLSGQTEVNARKSVFRALHHMIDHQRTPHTIITPALNVFYGTRQIQKLGIPESLYGEPFAVHHRHAAGFIRELEEWSTRLLTEGGFAALERRYKEREYGTPGRNRTPPPATAGERHDGRSG